MIGWGEVNLTAESAITYPDLAAEVKWLLNNIDTLAPLTVWAKAQQADISYLGRALIDAALWDRLAKKSGLPLASMLGLHLQPVPISMTISMGEKDWVYQRTCQIVDNFNPHFLKIKLGSSSGIKHDKNSYEAVLEALETRQNSGYHRLFVDANGGWHLNDAIDMSQWLAKRSAEYIEQPLAQGNESQLTHLKQFTALPIYLDESCQTSADILRYQHAIDGINIKLLKCGGVTEAFRLIHVAKTYGLKCMIGCFSESPHSIATAYHLTPLMDYIDLDSHLNLDHNKVIPKSNLDYQNGYILFNQNQAGIGEL